MIYLTGAQNLGHGVKNGDPRWQCLANWLHSSSCGLQLELCLELELEL